VIVGIDPGLQGAVAFLPERGGSINVVDTPSFLLSGKARDYDVPGMMSVLRVYEMGHVFIERWQARPEASPQSMGKIGYGFGLWVGMLAALLVPYTVVWPQTWQKEMYAGAVGEGKERSLLIASRLWPDLVIPKTRHDRADALLIAEWGRRTLRGDTARWEAVE
jgi:crossover junction endodeoxyribonuclease RuvC